MIASIIQILFILLFPALLKAEELPVKYAVAMSAVPVFNSPDFKEIFGGKDGRSLKTDKCGQIRELEFIALQGTVFIVRKYYPGRASDILEVTSDEYPHAPPKGLFIDKRFVSISDRPPQPRQRSLPQRDELINRLRALEGKGYVWGGNISRGMFELSDYYPLKSDMHPAGIKEKLWQLAGVDCSGLLYEVTGGWTPRNTSSLVSYGEPVEIEGLNAAAIIRKLKPLDLIVWPGHLLIYIDRGEIIESRLSCDGGKSGVIIEPALKRLREIIKTRRPVNSLKTGALTGKSFVVRRWIPPIK